MNEFPSHKPPNGRQAPQPDTGPNLSLGPGGLVSVASGENTPQLAPAPQSPNQAPLQIQSAVFPGGPSSTPGFTPVQPQRTSPGSQLSVLTAPTVSISTVTVTPMASSMVFSSFVISQPPSSVQPLAISTSAVLPVSTLMSTSMLVSISTSVPVPTVLPTSTSTPNDAIDENTSSSAVLETSATASGTSEPSETPSASAAASSSSSSHGPPFYVGIVLGTIVVVALLAALIAWGIRLRTHARRRSESKLDIPWAKSGTNEGILEEGRHLAFSGSRNLTVDTSALDFSSQDAMAHAHTWEPRGDRDVGEPRRAESTLNAPISPYHHPTPTQHDPFADPTSYQYQYPHLADSAAYPLPAYNNPYMTRRGATSHLTGSDFGARGSVDHHDSTSTLGPLQVANMTPGDASASSSRAPTVLGMNMTGSEDRDCGTPREDMSGTRPRFLGLHGEGLDVPWANAPTARPGLRSFGSRRSRRGSDGGNWEHLPPLPMPGNSTQAHEAAARDGWTAALKSNLINAFNAVAANLPTGPTMEEAREGRLTPIPSRQTDRSDRRLSSSNQWHKFAGEGQGNMHRDDTASSASAWTLQDNGDGTGTVHFRGLERYHNGGDHALPLSPLSLQDEDRSDVGTNMDRPLTQDSQTPLMVAKKPKSAFLRPDICTRLSNYGKGMRLSPDGYAGSISRASSVYSMASGTSSAFPGGGTPVPHPPRIPMLSRHSTMAIDVVGPGAKKDGAHHERPVNVSRLSSSGCSFSTYRTDGTTTAMSDGSGDEEAVHNAITDRRRRLRRVM